MRQLVLFLFLIIFTATPVAAEELAYTAPTVPASAQDLLPEAPKTFSQGIRTILKEVLPQVTPALAEASTVCLRIVALVLLLSILENFKSKNTQTLRLIGAISIAAVLLAATKAMIPLGENTVRDISNYGKLLMPVMASAMAAQGYVGASSALYAGTALFNAILGSLVESVLVPMVYGFLALAIASHATGEDTLSRFKDTVKGSVTWGLKTLLYIFTGYMTISGVISGSADAMAVKAAKITISSAVPVVGGILSDASEAVLVSAGVMKNAAGVYGILAVLAVAVGPFLRLGVQYLMLKLTGTLCSVFGSKPACNLIQDFSAAMGLILAMTAAVSMMLVISTVCFMKVVG